MRYPPHETAAKHRRLLDAASTMIRERGIDGVSVNEVMKAAGMTHGAFYAHFDNKDELVSAAIQEAMEQGDATLNAALADAATARETFVGTYLSETHREQCGQGCPMPALAVEIGRRGRDKPKLSRHVRGLIERIAAGFRWTSRGSKRDQAILMTSAMVGAIVLARSVDDRKLSDEILAATKRQLLRDG